MPGSDELRVAQPLAPLSVLKARSSVLIKRCCCLPVGCTVRTPVVITLFLSPITHTHGHMHTHARTHTTAFATNHMAWYPK